MGAELPFEPNSRPFVIEDGRYSRLRLIPWWDQDRLEKATVLVAGIGALGNEICKNLALVGVGTLVLVDFDTVEISNLSRAVLFRHSDAGKSKVEVAARRIRDLNPDVRPVPLHADVAGEVGLGWFLDADIVLGALDNREARLWLNRCARRAGTPWIDGGIQEIAGQVRVFHPEGACYECGMTGADYAHLNLRYSCPGLRRSDLDEGKIPTTPTISSIIAGLQVQEGLKILHGRGPGDSRAWMFNGNTNLFYSSDLVPREDCLSHEIYPDPTPLPLSAAGATVSDLFSALSPEVDGPLTLELDRDLIVGFSCPHCGTEEEILTPSSKTDDSRLACRRCGKDRIPRSTYRIEEGSPLASRTLASLGVPPYHVVRVTSPGEEAFVLLAGDAPTPSGTLFEGE